MQALRRRNFSPAVPVHKLAINPLASAETFFRAMPVFDSALSQLPAQAHVAVLEAAHEIDQADLQILHDGAGSLDPFERLL